MDRPTPISQLQSAGMVLHKKGSNMINRYIEVIENTDFNKFYKLKV